MSFTFGSPAGQPAANSTGFGFGAPKTNATAAAPGLGGANTSFSFGAPAATTGTTNAAPATNFNFGTPAAAAPAQPQLSFGTPAAAAPTFGLGGNTTTPAPTFGLGGSSTAVPTLGLGTSTSAPTLGGAAAPTFGLGGGTGTTAAAAAPTFGLGSNAQSTTAAAPTFGLGGTAAQTSTAAAPTFGLGGTAQTTAAAPTFGLGGTAQPATAAAAPTFGLGGTAQAPTAAAPTFGLGGSSTLPTLNTGGGLFGKQAATTTQAQPAAGLNFGTTTTSASLSLGASGGLFGKPAGAAAQASANTTAPFVGLGGIDVSATQPKAGASKQDIKVKETIVPEEIGKTVEAMKKFIKEQKQMASDIGRVSTSKLTKVSMEIARVKTSIQNISNSVEANYATTQMLRLETSKANHTVDMAQRTQDTPPGLQFENNAPFIYFQNLVNNYEKELLSMKEHIALTEHHMRSLTNPQSVTPDDLKRGFQQINESFISLAGRLHEIHQKVEVQKEQFLNLRKYRLQDSTDVFSSIDKPTAKPNTSHLTGRTPFTNVSAISGLNKMYSNLSSSGVAGNATNVSSQTGH